ncbi:hypothetical protein SAY87_025381 [Trapa incisa]|uniref:UDP-N-acetylmuramate--L-alanine ligase n=1 Tax=Trapa incisa TaxID=236973 RepID=A0AAN7GDJ4_9MYRT|nr:hypothetical protein SAY87_025381 [Trapa incisa]
MESATRIPSISAGFFPTKKLEVHFPGILYRAQTWNLPAIVPAAARNMRLRMNVAFSESGNGDQEESLDLRNGKGRWIHFVGIGGCGLSALAKLAVKRGFEVSGSDIVWNSFMDELHQMGAHLCIGHSGLNIQRGNELRYPDSLVVSSAIPPDNVEVLQANAAKIPVFKRDYWLGMLTDDHNLIAVSGSHGKSTTAAMLAYVLKSMGDDVTAIVGAHVSQFPEENVIAGLGQNFVLEADEYDGCFLGLSPHIAVVTNLEWEHVDQFPDEESVKKIFRMFLNRIKEGGHLILCGDSPGACSLVDCGGGSIRSYKSRGAVQVPESNSYTITTYGSSITNEWQASFIRPNSMGGSDYTLIYKGLPVSEISLQIAGVHNVLNSMAVIVAVVALFGDQTGILDLIDHMKTHLRNFAGVSRRFEKVGSVCGCDIYDDYAHHPTEISAVLKAARDMFPFKTLIVVFQPHTYSRLVALLDDFASALRGADRVVVTAVYAAREKNVWDVNGRDLASRIGGTESEYIPFLDSVVDKLVLDISDEPLREILVLTMGAGDITTVGPKLLSRLINMTQESCGREM